MPPAERRLPASHGAFRLPQGGRIQRERLFPVLIDGRQYHGLEGDTVASMLLAHGVRLVGRSRSFHRPRGIMTAAACEPNALLAVGRKADRLTNIPATLLEVAEGLEARSQHGWPTLRWDLLELQSLLSPLMVAGAAFKTWKGPSTGTWHIAERLLRRLPSLGGARELPDADRYDWHHGRCDLLVAGSGPAGLVAALGGAQAGLDVLLVEQDFDLGGSLLDHPVDSAAAHWLRSLRQQLVDTGRVRMLTRATAFGVEAGPQVLVTQRMAPGRADPQAGLPRERLHRIHALRVVVTTGANEQPLLFAGNDKPGVMLAGAVEQYLHRYAVLPGRRAVVATTCDTAYRSALALARTGAQVRLVDLRSEVAPALAAQARAAGVDLRVGWALTQVGGWPQARNCLLAPYDLASGRVLVPAGEAVEADLVAVCGGWSPDRGLAAHAPQDAEGPTGTTAGCVVAGAAAGARTWREALEDAWAAAGAAAAACGRSLAAACPAPPQDPDLSLAAATTGPILQGKGSVFVDLQQDVRLQDVALALREGYHTPGQLSAYTGLGLGPDQGRTAWPQVQALLAAQSGAQGLERVVWQPASPVAVGTLAGRAVRARLAPVRRGPLHAWHEAQGAEMGGDPAWAQPQWYRSHGMDVASACRVEVGFALGQLGITDLTGQGLWALQGPDAAGLLQRAGLAGAVDLVPGRVMAGFLLRADGTLCAPVRAVAITPHHLRMQAPADLAGGVAARLGSVLQAEPALRVTVTDVVDQWAALCLAGAATPQLLCAAFPYLEPGAGAAASRHVLGQGALAGVPLCLLDPGWPGITACEIQVPTQDLPRLWHHLLAAGRPWNLRPFGARALAILRAAAGEVGAAELAQGLVPADLQGSPAGESPDPQRLAVVGLAPVDADEPPEVGSFLFFEGEPAQGLGRGRVTSLLHGLRPDHTLALGLLEGGSAHRGRELVAVSPVTGRDYPLRVVDGPLLASSSPPAPSLPAAGAVPALPAPDVEPPAPAAVPRGPFADLQPLERPSRSGQIGVRLATTGAVPVWRFAVWPQGVATLESALARWLGPGLFPPLLPGAGRMLPTPRGRLLRWGPAAFVLLDATEPLELDMDLDAGSLVDLGHAYVRVAIGGVDSRGLLAKLWPLDLRDGAFPDGACSILPLDALGGCSPDCVLLRVGAQDYELLLPASLAQDRLDALVDAALEYGVALTVPQASGATSTRQS